MALLRLQQDRAGQIPTAATRGAAPTAVAMAEAHGALATAASITTTVATQATPGGVTTREAVGQPAGVTARLVAADHLVVVAADAAPVVAAAAVPPEADTNSLSSQRFGRVSSGIN